MSREELMLRIQRLSFAKVEAELFLDTHPDCPTALEYYHGILEQLDTAMAEYENSYGPIRHEGVGRDGWSWVNTPWPWQENGENAHGGKR